MRERRLTSAGGKLSRPFAVLGIAALMMALGCDLDKPVQKASPPQPQSLFKEIPMGDQNLKPR